VRAGSGGVTVRAYRSQPLVAVSPAGSVSAPAPAPLRRRHDAHGVSLAPARSAAAAPAQDGTECVVTRHCARLI
jgi:hypothetical protein